MVRYRAIRALERRAATPSLALDRAPLQRGDRRTVSRAYRYLDRRLVLARGAVEEKRLTPGHELSSDARDKQKNAVGRIFRLLGLAIPTEDSRASTAGSPATGRRRGRAASSWSKTWSNRRSAAVVGLIDDLSDAERLAARGPTTGQRGRATKSSSSGCSRARARRSRTSAYHIGELRLVRCAPREASSASRARAAPRGRRRTLSILARRPRPADGRGAPGGGAVVLTDVPLSQPVRDRGSSCPLAPVRSRGLDDEASPRWPSTRRLRAGSAPAKSLADRGRARQPRYVVVAGRLTSRREGASRRRLAARQRRGHAGGHRRVAVGVTALAARRTATGVEIPSAP